MMFIIYGVMGTMCLVTIIPVLFLKVDDIYAWALEYDTQLAELFDKPTFMILAHSVTDIPAIVTIVVVGSLGLLCIVSGVTFIYSLKSFQDKTTLNKRFQRSLLISALVQMSLTVCFLIIPIIVFFIFIKFRTAYSGRPIQIFMCMLASHCFLDYITTLYFIVPYRKFIINKLPFKKNSTIVIIRRSQHKSQANSARSTV